MFSRSTVRYGDTPQPETRHRAARQEWDGRFGSVYVLARNSWLALMAMIAVNAGLGAALTWQVERGTVKPWVVEIDKLGEARAVAPATSDYRPTDPQIAWYLWHFIKWVRTIPTDRVVQQGNWLEAYKFADDKGRLALNDYVQHADPFTKGQHEQVAVDVSSVIRASDDSFRIEWVEHHFVDGALAATEHWSAILTIVVAAPSDQPTITANPLGIYVHAFNWSKELG